MFYKVVKLEHQTKVNSNEAACQPPEPGRTWQKHAVQLYAHASHLSRSAAGVRYSAAAVHRLGGHLQPGRGIVQEPFALWLTALSRPALAGQTLLQIMGPASGGM